MDLRRTRLAGGAATLLSGHAGTSPTGDERHSERWSGPTADSLKESQLAAGRGAFTSRRTSPTSQIETASLAAAVRPRQKRLPRPCTELRRADPHGPTRNRGSMCASSALSAQIVAEPLGPDAAERAVETRRSKPADRHARRRCRISYASSTCRLLSGATTITRASARRRGHREERHRRGEFAHAFACDPPARFPGDSETAD